MHLGREAPSSRKGNRRDSTKHHDAETRYLPLAAGDCNYPNSSLGGGRWLLLASVSQLRAHASVPEFVKRTISTDGTASITWQAMQLPASHGKEMRVSGRCAPQKDCNGDSSALYGGIAPEDYNARNSVLYGGIPPRRVRGHHLGELVLQRARGAEGGALIHGLLDAREDLVPSMGRRCSIVLRH